MDWFTLAFISALLSAVAAIMQKKILFTVSALDFSFVLSLLSLLFSVPFLMAVDYQSLSLLSTFVLFFKTVLTSLAFLCVMLAIKNLEISKALPLMVLTPGFVAITGFVFLGEGLSFNEITGMLLLLAGTYILEMKREGRLLQPFKVFVTSEKHHYIIFALLLFTATSVMDKLLLSHLRVSAYTFMGFQHVFMAFNFFVIAMIFKKGKEKLFPQMSRNIFLLIIITAVITVGYRYAQVEAIKIANVALVLSVKRISVFFATLAGGKIFQEGNLWRKAIATAVLIAGAFFILEE